MDDFYITLMSDSSLNLYPNNSVSEFKCKLAKSFRIKKEEWRVALTEITYPGSILIVVKEEENFTFTLPDTIPVTRPGPYHGTLLIRSYDTPLEFIRSINASIKEVLNKVVNMFAGPGALLFSVDILIKIILKLGAYNSICELHTIPNDVDIGITFHPNICKKLGFLNASNDTVIHPISFQLSPFKEPVNLLINDSALYVYIDIIEPVMISDSEEQLLRVLPFKSKSNINHYSTQEFQHDQYIKLNTNNLDEISIHIKNVSNNNIHFQDGKSIITLHFMRENLFNNYV